MKNYLSLGPIHLRVSRKHLAPWGYAWLQIGGLAVVSKTNSDGLWNLAAYHSPHSLTWSWILSLHTPRPGQGRWLYFHRYKDNAGFKWHLAVAKFALSWQTQRPMWYRDMYVRMRDEEDQRRGMLWLNDKHPHKIHTEPKPPAPTVAAPSAIQ